MAEYLSKNVSNLDMSKREVLPPRCIVFCKTKIIILVSSQWETIAFNCRKVSSSKFAFKMLAENLFEIPEWKKKSYCDRKIFLSWHSRDYFFQSGRNSLPKIA